MDNYKWVAENNSFVLYQNDKPTRTKVSFNKGIWGITDQGINLPQYYFDTPSEAMALVNKSHHIEAPYDEYEGLTLVIDSIKNDIDNSFDSVDSSLTLIRNNLNQLVSIYQNDVIFNDVSLLIDDYLLETFNMNKNIRKRLDDLVRSTENRRKHSK